MMKRKICPICITATKALYYREKANGTFISQKETVYCGKCKTVYHLRDDKIRLRKGEEFDLEDIIIFLTNKKLRQLEKRGIVGKDIDYILRRTVGKGIKENRFARTLIGFVNEYLREQQT